MKASTLLKRAAAAIDEGKNRCCCPAINRLAHESVARKYKLGPDIWSQKAHWEYRDLTSQAISFLKLVAPIPHPSYADISFWYGVPTKPINQLTRAIALQLASYLAKEEGL